MNVVRIAVTRLINAYEVCSEFCWQSGTIHGLAALVYRFRFALYWPLTQDEEIHIRVDNLVSGMSSDVAQIRNFSFTSANGSHMQVIVTNAATSGVEIISLIEQLVLSGVADITEVGIDVDSSVTTIYAQARTTNGQQ
eukprot:m.103796 g.103796  ORF g.103796 m.103796 type:complete len:138 (+) comp27518_c0_seq1:461-874(+)